jgi:hypothetical protein
LFGDGSPDDVARIAGGACAELFRFDSAVLTTPI